MSDGLNGDEGNRTLIPAMRPRCAPVTPRPQIPVFYLSLYWVMMPVFFRKKVQVRISTFRGMRYYLQVLVWALAADLPDSPVPSIQ